MAAQASGPDDAIARVNGEAIVRSELLGRSLGVRIDELLLRQRARTLHIDVESVIRLDVSWRNEPNALRQYLSRLRQDALIELKEGWIDENAPPTHSSSTTAAQCHSSASTQ